MEILQPLWRGKSISLRKDSRGKYAAMSGKDALLYVPVKVRENSTYKITIELCKESGNGMVYCNLYGNRSFDFPESKIECKRDGWCTYDVDVTTKSFPKTVPMVFRVWRKPKGTGTILVRKVIVELMDGKVIPIREGMVVATEASQSSVHNERYPNLRIKKPHEPLRRGVATAKDFARKTRTRKVRRGRGRAGFRPIQPRLAIGKYLPKVNKLVPGENGIKNSVIISMKNRAEFLNRTLWTYAKQTMPKEEFEIIIVDDGSTQDLLGVCKKHASMSGLQFQYIRVDTSKGAIPQRGFTPALTNNIGFKKARGAVFVITGPESLQKETNMELTWKSCRGATCIYGITYKASGAFVDGLRANKNWHDYTHLKKLVNNAGPQVRRASTSGFWWYYAATRKEYIMLTRGVDERYMEGICGEDDDFASRMKFLGLTLRHNHDIFCIHQDHAREDRADSDHKIRFNKELWRHLRQHNMRLLDSCMWSGDPIVNKGIDWGTEKAIVDLKVF
jgi:glycosyltransferase involved in cell wall biosynthesis